MMSANGTKRLISGRTHWRHLRTTNIIESNFDVVRPRSNVCKRLRQPKSATYLVWALLVRRKERWRSFNGYALLARVHQAMRGKRSDRVVALRKAA
jgi:putative transposase